MGLFALSQRRTALCKFNYDDTGETLKKKPNRYGAGTGGLLSCPPKPMALFMTAQ